MPPCQGGCREFEPRLPLHKRQRFQAFVFYSICDYSHKFLTFSLQILPFFRTYTRKIFCHSEAQSAEESRLLSICYSRKPIEYKCPKSPISVTKMSAKYLVQKIASSLTKGGNLTPSLFKGRLEWVACTTFFLFISKFGLRL